MPLVGVMGGNTGRATVVEDEIPRRFGGAPKLVAHPRCDGAPPAIAGALAEL